MRVFPLKTMKLRTKQLDSSYGATFGQVRNWNAESKHFTKFHQGWDLEAPTGTDCYAVADGIVVAVGVHPQFGRYVNLQFNESATAPRSSAPGDLFAFYAHLSLALVHVGQSVRAGEKIGLTGHSGNASASAPHLHFEIRSTSTTSPGLGASGRVDPAKVLGYGFLRSI